MGQAGRVYIGIVSSGEQTIDLASHKGTLSVSFEGPDVTMDQLTRSTVHPCFPGSATPDSRNQADNGRSHSAEANKDPPIT